MLLWGGREFDIDSSSLLPLLKCTLCHHTSNSQKVTKDVKVANNEQNNEFVIPYPFPTYEDMKGTKGKQEKQLQTNLKENWQRSCAVG